MGARTRTSGFPARNSPQSLVYGEIDFWSFYDVIRVAVDGIDADQHDTNNAEAPPAGAAAENTNGRHRIQHGIGDRGKNRPDTPEGGGGTRKSSKEAHGKREHWPTGAVEAEAAAMGGGGGKEQGLKFYDLGSGSGRAIFAAVLAVDFR